MRKARFTEIRGTGYVVQALEAALWAFQNSNSFEEGCLIAVNLGDDADTTGAIYGQIAGAYYGDAGIRRLFTKPGHGLKDINSLGDADLRIPVDVSPRQRILNSCHDPQHPYGVAQAEGGVLLHQIAIEVVSVGNAFSQAVVRGREASRAVIGVGHDGGACLKNEKKGKSDEQCGKQ